MTDLSDPLSLKGLYLVATPIGHMHDITLRALLILQNVDCIACEDTRNTRKLLHFHKIASKSCLSYHDHNAASMRPLLLERLKAGKTTALVSDGGMPLISDPGYKLVQLCFAEEIPVTVIPGPSSPLSALSVSGLPPDRFFFQGFLPSREGARARVLQELALLPVTLVFFEAPHRLLSCLKAMETVFGNRKAAVLRELTKKFEEGKRGFLQELIDFYTKNPPRGEIIVVVGGSLGQSVDPGASWQKGLEKALKSLPLKEAVQQVVDMTGLSRRQIYQMALKLRGSYEKQTKNERFPLS